MHLDSIIVWLVDLYRSDIQLLTGDYSIGAIPRSEYLPLPSSLFLWKPNEHPVTDLIVAVSGSAVMVLHVPLLSTLHALVS